MRENIKINDVGEILNEVKSWIIKHRETFFTVCIITLLVIGFNIYFFVHYFSIQHKAFEKLSFGQGYAYAGINDQAIKIFDEIINNYPKSKPVDYAKLYKADILYYMNNFQEANKLYDNIIKESKNKIVLPFAYIGSGICNENIGNYSQSIKIYLEFIDRFPEHFLLPRVYESLARVYSLSGSIEQSKNTYEKIITLFPGTMYAKKAQNELNIILQQKNVPSNQNKNK
jgi:tetratricopeptide (TPR) repeat protein